MNAKKGILFILMAIVVFGASGCCWCPPPAVGEPGGVVDGIDGYSGSSLSVEWASRNMLHGYDMYHSNKGALNTSADIKWGNTGFGSSVTWTKPTQSGYEDWEWLLFEMYYFPEDYFPCCWADKPYAMRTKIGWRYYYFPDGPYRASGYYSYGDGMDHGSSYYYHCHKLDLDFQEFYARFYWPRLCCWGIVPYYEALWLWPSAGGRYDCSYGCGKSYWRRYGGTIHTFGAYKDWQLDGFWPTRPGSTVRANFEVVYNGGAGPTVDTSKRRADHCLSHCLFGLATNIPLTNNVSFTAGLNHQVSMDQSVNNDNETWFTLGSRIALDNVD